MPENFTITETHTRNRDRIINTQTDTRKWLFFKKFSYFNFKTDCRLHCSTSKSFNPIVRLDSLPYYCRDRLHSHWKDGRAFRSGEQDKCINILEVCKSAREFSPFNVHNRLLKLYRVSTLYSHLDQPGDWEYGASQHPNPWGKQAYTFDSSI